MIGYSFWKNVDSLDPIVVSVMTSEKLSGGEADFFHKIIQNPQKIIVTKDELGE